MSTTTTFRSATTTSHTDTSVGLTRTLTATGVVLGANTLVWVVGRIGEPIRVVIGSDAAPEPLAWAHVAITTIAATVLGGVVLAVMQRRGRGLERVWAAGAVAIAVVSAVPLWRLEIDTTSKTLLTLMHLLTGVCCVAVHLADRRRFTPRRAGDPAAS
jgi:LytS/YehU family sensor histidine kinase